MTAVAAATRVRPPSGRRAAENSSAVASRMTSTHGDTMLADLLENTATHTEDSSGGETTDVPPIVREELQLLDVVLRKLDAGGPKRTRTHVDDASALIELRDALAEAKPEDQGSILEQMHRIEALSRQRGKGDSPPVDRKSPYFGHLRLEESGKRRDVLVGARSFVEPGGGVQIVDWRNAPISRLFYRYEEGDGYEERIGDRLVEGEILARRTVAIVEAELRRVASPQATFSRDLRSGAWREVAAGSRACRSPATAARPRSSRRRPGEALRRRPPPSPSRAAARLRRSRRAPSRSPPAGHRRAHRSAAVRAHHPTLVGAHRHPGLGGQRKDHDRSAPDRLPGLRRAAPLPPRQDAGDRLPACPGGRTCRGCCRRSTWKACPSRRSPAGPRRPARRGARLRRYRPHRRDAVAGDAGQGARGISAHHRRSAAGVRPNGAGPGSRASSKARRTWPPRSRSGTRTTGPVDLRVTALATWLRDTPRRRRHPQCARKHRPVAAGAYPRRGWRVGVACSPTARRSAPGFERHAPGMFSSGQLDDIHRWCVERDRLRTAGRLTRTTRPLRARRRGRRAAAPHLPAAAGAPPRRQRGPLAYEHLMVDEVQDFSPLELSVLAGHHLRTAVGHAGRRHRAGDRARARLLELGRAARLSAASPTSASNRCG